MLWLDNQNATFCNTSSVDTADGFNQGGIYAEAARKRKIEDGSVGKARELGNKQLEHLI